MKSEKKSVLENNFCTVAEGENVCEAKANFLFSLSAVGAHTQPKATTGKKVCFRFAKIFAFGDGVFLEDTF